MKGKLLTRNRIYRKFWGRSDLRLYWTAHDAKVLRLAEEGKLPDSWKD